MKSKLLKYFVMAMMMLILFITDIAAVEVNTRWVEKNIRTTIKYLINREETRGNCKIGFYSMMNAIEELLPAAGYPESTNTKIKRAHQLFKRHGIFNPNGIELLKEAYRRANNGTEFKMPRTADIKEIKMLLEGLANKSIRATQKKEYAAAVKLLLKIGNMIVAPVSNG